MLILFLNDANGYEYRDPYAYLVQFQDNITNKQLRDLEYTQVGASRTGGSLDQLLRDVFNRLHNPYERIREGRLSDFPDHEYEVYTLISGNY